MRYVERGGTRFGSTASSTDLKIFPPQMILRLNECVQDKPEPEKFPTAPQTQSRASNKMELFLMVVLTRATFFKCHCHIKPISCANILRTIAGMSQSIFNVIVIFI